jgi:hypothetical protein
MPYIGNPSAQRFNSPRAASVYSGDGSTVAFTLEEVVSTDEDILVSVDGVIQEPSVAYAVSSGTTLTFTAAPSTNSGNNIFVYYIARTFGSVSMPDGQNVNASNFSASGTGAITGNTTVGGTLGVTGIATFTDDIIIGDGKTIGSASDTDAMAISSGGVVTFSQSPVGTGLTLLLDATISSAVAQYDISSTYINSTYDTYYLSGYFLGDADTRYFQGRVFVGGTVQTGNIYAFETQRIGAASSDGSTNENSENHLFSANTAGFGGAAGEGITVNMTFQNTNNTIAPFCCSGFSNWGFTDAAHNSNVFGGSLLVANRANVVNGLRLKMHTGNISVGSFKLYGLRS